ncbi:MAG: hypothetical protein GY861_12585 [bacterium]|nr:hypothetical protein [bacterium]
MMKIAAECAKCHTLLIISNIDGVDQKTIEFISHLTQSVLEAKCPECNYVNKVTVRIETE